MSNFKGMFNSLLTHQMALLAYDVRASTCQIFIFACPTLSTDILPQFKQRLFRFLLPEFQLI
jgi:hypothetical protein